MNPVTALRLRIVDWLTGWLADPYQPAAFAEQDEPEPLCPMPVPVDGCNCPVCTTARAAGDLLAADLLAEVTRVQQDPLALVPLPRLESERGGIPTGQLYPHDETGRAS